MKKFIPIFILLLTIVNGQDRFAKKGKTVSAQKDGVDLPIFMAVPNNTIGKELYSSSPPFLANYFDFLGASRWRPQTCSAWPLRHLGKRSNVSTATIYRSS